MYVYQKDEKCRRSGIKPVFFPLRKGAPAIDVNSDHTQNALTCQQNVSE